MVQGRLPEIPWLLRSTRLLRIFEDVHVLCSSLKEVANQHDIHVPRQSLDSISLKGKHKASSIFDVLARNDEAMLKNSWLIPCSVHRVSMVSEVTLMGRKEWYCERQLHRISRSSGLQ